MQPAHIEKTDVLIIGGGAAALRAAIEAQDLGVEVTVATKGLLGRSGCSVSATHISAAAAWSVPGDSHELGIQDNLKAGEGLADTELVRILVEEGAQAMRDLERFGVIWQRDPEGKINVYTVGGHSVPRTVSFYGDRAGNMVMSTFVKEVRRRPIKVVEEIMMTKLLQNDNQVVGAIGYDYGKGEIKVFAAKSIILATGGYSQIYSPTTVAREDTGDGQVMGLDVGAQLIDMEMVIFLPGGVVFGGDVNIPVRFGPHKDTPHLLNVRGERFMEKLDPVNKEFGTKEDLVTAILSEVRSGRGTENGGVYADLRHLPWDDPAVKSFYEIVIELGAPFGKDPRLDLIEIVPIAHTSIGGILINENCETGVDGMYAVGSVAHGIYGFARIEGFTLCITQVFGKRAGATAAKRAARISSPRISLDQVEEESARIKAALNDTKGISPSAARAELHSILGNYAGVLKNGNGLKIGLEKLRELKGKKVSVKSKVRYYNYDLVEFLELRNMLQVSEALFLGSIMRKETRGAFMREDYREKNNDDWLTHIVYRKNHEGQLDIYTQPLKVKATALV